MYNGMLRRVCAEEGASEVCVCVYVHVCVWGGRDGDSIDVIYYVTWIGNVNTS